MRNYSAKKNLIAASANAKETAINTEQTLDTTFMFNLSTVINPENRRETNEDEVTGREEPDLVYDLGKIVPSFALESEKAQPQHFAFLLGYGLGSVSTAAAGTGYEHTITPIDGDLDQDRSNPGFTAAMRYGNTVLKRRFASMFVDQVVSTFARDSWLRIAAQIVGTGKTTENVVEESISALNNATSLTLAANGVEGSTAAERLRNVHRIRVELTSGVWTEVEFSAVSSATPAAITITDPGGDGLSSVTYRVLYVPTESGWMSFPSRISETPLRVGQVTFKLGGTWNGTAFQGGRELKSEVKTVEHQLNNNLDIEHTFGTNDTYAGRAIRNGRLQTLKADRDFRDFILQQHISDNDTFGVYLLAEGAVFDSPHKYQVEMIFPKCAVLQAPISVDGKRLAEAGNLQVLEDDTYGSIIVKVKNLQSAYAA